MPKVRRGFNHLPATIRAMQPSAENLVEKIVVDIAAGAGATAPIDTGALAASYTGETEGLDGQAGTNMEYGPYVEYGTIFNAAQPHLVPAMDRVVDLIKGPARAMGIEIERKTQRG
jgi:hypothetical protein